MTGITKLMTICKKKFIKLVTQINSDISYGLGDVDISVAVHQKPKGRPRTATPIPRERFCRGKPVFITTLTITSDEAFFYFFFFIPHPELGGQRLGEI